MSMVREWFTAITGIIILSALGDGILPSGNIKKYVKLLFGLIFIITVCRPFLSGDIEEFKIETESNRAYQTTKNMEDKERETVLRLYKANISKQMMTLLEDICKGCETEVLPDIETQDMEHFGKIKGVIVTIKTHDKDIYLNDQIEEIISRTYGINKKNIAIKYTEAE